MSNHTAILIYYDFRVVPTVQLSVQFQYPLHNFEEIGGKGALNEVDF